MTPTRTLALGLALVALLAPAAGAAQGREWVEDYTDEWDDSSQGYDVDVDLEVNGSVSIDTFQEPLAAHGQWVVSGSYGRVWRPHVAAGWRPYYYGHWEWTNEGWYWVSDEPWGWAAYHYGRWAWEPGYGWIWVPGYQWAPAWVTWRYSGDVIGWAPLAPGLSIYVTSYAYHDVWWTFVPTVRFVSVPVYTVAYGPSYTRRYYRSTAPAPPPRSRAAPVPGGRAAPAPAWGGPAPRLIEQRTGRRIAPARVVPAASPSARARPGEIPVYRPDARPGPRGGGVVRSDRGRGRGTDAAPPPGRGGSAGAPGRDGRRETAPASSFTDRPGRDRGAPPGWSRPPRGDAPSRSAAPRSRGEAPARAAPPRASGGARGDSRAAPREERRNDASPDGDRESRRDRAGPAPKSSGSSGGGWSAPRGGARSSGRAPSGGSAPSRPAPRR